MDVSKYMSWVLCMIVSVGLDLIGAQSSYLGSSYRRRGYLGRETGLYPRYPAPGLHGLSFERDPYFRRPLVGVRPGVLPIGGVPVARVPEILPVAPLSRRPDIVRDNSERNNINLNIHNENNNVHDQRGSGRVEVTQGSGTCRRACPDGYCPNPFQRCVRDTNCPGNYGCQDYDFMV